MNSTALIFKKEIDRFLSNKVTAILSIVLPGVLIFMLWSVMGDIVNADDDKPVRLGAVNLPASIGEAVHDEEITLFEIGALPENGAMYSEIKSGEYEALVVFPEAFDERFASNASTQGADPLQIEVYYNSGIPDSLRAYEAATSLLNAFESSVVDLLDVNAGDGDYDLATKQDKAGFVAVSIIPFMLLILVFSSSMSVAAESIAGEKERGTLATLLATPIKRRTVGRGKLLACSLIGLAIAVSSAIGIFASLPSIMQDNIDLSVYGFAEYGLTALVVVSLTVLIVVTIMVVSAFAKTTKEAQMLLMPVMILVMGVGLLGMVGSEPQSSIAYYLIPLYNGVEAMIGVLLFDFDMANLVVCIASNIAYAGILVLVLERLFESERLMFAR